MATPEQKRKYRRKTLHGFPVEEKFHEPEQIEAYFSNPKLTCLRCGKKYRSLALHLSGVHEMAADEYRKIYGLPYYRGLVGCDTRDLHSENAKQKYEDGIWEASPERARMARERIGSYGDRRQDYRDVLTQRNLELMNEGKTGEEAKRRANRSTWGSEDHKRKLKARPQCSPPSENFIYYWVGRKQSDDHVFKRTGSAPKNTA